MILTRRGKAAFVLVAALLIAAVVGTGLLLRSLYANRRAAMDPASAAAHPIVPGRAIGPIHLGMTQDDVQRLLGKPDLVQGGRTWSFDKPDIAVMFAKDSPTVAAIFAGGGPARASVPFRSVEGIGLGSTREQVKAAWGEPDKQSDNGMTYRSRGIDLLFGNDKLEWFCVRDYPTTQPTTAPL